MHQAVVDSSHSSHRSKIWRGYQCDVQFSVLLRFPRRAAIMWTYVPRTYACDVSGDRLSSPAPIAELRGNVTDK
ncbi:jg12184 [Pararge aegeria aegeria]|uniref:Jg12184 protein n=1 Tax=Pararge aegeria aegeria TaxID=348720 RepID=A0A8S4REU2_9NEOP|nr:jg12184 [Pararge aegeria aegeria]